MHALIIKTVTGQFCEKSVTKDIYSYYNNLVSRTGALGVLAVIPLLLIYATCDRYAKRRQQERVERHLIGTGLFTHPNKTVNPEAIESLLYSESE
ncbi:unnamed protein product [Cylicostephanus goldi]|uniref:Uncharacterized protein n=1 Tax=Cylicostephanus goldi TaxID=71465 RepID=A0A3P6PY49_CYLGO|nr:unnamed protein product [Cylicostephanus goldi]